MEPVIKMQELFAAVGTLHHDFLEYLLQLTDEIRTSKLSDPQLCDVGYLLREIETLLDDWRKDCKARKELAGKILAFNFTQASLSDATLTRIKGTLATGTPDVKVRVKIPPKGTPEYAEALKVLNVPEALVKDGVLKIDWDGISAMATRYANEGKNMPAVLNQTFPEYVTVFRKR